MNQIRTNSATEAEYVKKFQLYESVCARAREPSVRIFATMRFGNDIAPLNVHDFFFVLFFPSTAYRILLFYSPQLLHMLHNGNWFDMCVCVLWYVVCDAVQRAVSIVGTHGIGNCDFSG